MTTKKLFIFLVIAAIALLTGSSLLWALFVCGLIELSLRLEKMWPTRTAPTSKLCR